ncbi:MAG: hypothetical protein ABIK28_12925 [Planctomycetota bacterium]
MKLTVISVGLCLVFNTALFGSSNFPANEDPLWVTCSSGSSVGNATADWSLLSDSYTVSVLGGVAHFYLYPGKNYRFRNYLLLGSQRNRAGHAAPGRHGDIAVELRPLHGHGPCLPQHLPVL